MPASARAGEPEFFFFSPQVGSANFSLLKETAETYFRQSGLSLSFHPFARLEDLERESARRNPAFLLVPAWAIENACLAERLDTVGRPSRNGLPHDRRALLARKTISSAAGLAGSAIATTVHRSGAAAGSGALARLRADQPNVRVIPVPKDVDALLAVGLGQVDAAFVSIAEFERLANVNPQLTANLHEIGYSENAPFPALYATPGADGQIVERLSAALVLAARDPLGRELIGLLGYDQWDRVSEPAPVPTCKAEGASR
jgi:ABC-type amino acid transport substrate-binding protein